MAGIICPSCRQPNRPTARFCKSCGGSLAAAQVVHLRPGQVMAGRYTIQQELGRGGMGAVYLAYETIAATRRPVVVKEMLDYFDPTDPVGEQRARQRFEAEAATLVSLSAQGIPQIFAYFSDQGRNYIVMQYIQGNNLENGLTRMDANKNQVQGRPYPVDRVREWAGQLCRVLVYLAAQNVVHMDIKPANLILDPSGNIWLVDFGTAKAQRMIQPGGTVGMQKSSIYGTQGYAPPEQYKGQAEPRSDVYALAATLYHLLTDDDPRDHPFQFPKLNQIPGDLADPLRRAQVSDPTQRITAAEMRQLLTRSGSNFLPFRWRDGAESHTPEALATCAATRWDEARGYFTGKEWETWLQGTHRNDILAHLQTARKQHAEANLGLDWFVRRLYPNFPPPRLGLDIRQVDFGSVGWSAKPVSRFTVLNLGSGCLQGTIQGLPSWLSVTPQTFAGNGSQMVQVTADTTNLTPRIAPHVAQIAVGTAHGEQGIVGISIQVPEPYLSINKRILSLGNVLDGQKATTEVVVSNTGGSAFDGKISGYSSWLTLSSASFRCQPGKDVRITATATGDDLGLGGNRTQLRIEGTSGGWKQEVFVPVVASKPRLRSLWRKWSPSLDLIATNMAIFTLMFFMVQQRAVNLWFLRSVRWAWMIMSVNPAQWIVELSVGDIALRQILANVLAVPAASLTLLTDGMGLIVLWFGGWVGVLLYPRAKRIKFGTLGIGLLLPWIHSFWAGLMGSLLALLAVALGGLTDLWPALTPSLLTIFVLTALLMGWLGRPSQSEPTNYSGWRAIGLGVPILAGMIWLIASPAYWWTPAVLPGLNRSVSAAAFAGGGSQLIVAGSNIELVDTLTGLSLGEFSASPNWPRDMAVSPYTGNFALASSDGLWVRDQAANPELWQGDSGGNQNLLQVAYSFDGRFIYTGNSSGEVQIWDTDTNAEIGNFSAHRGTVAGIAASPARHAFVSAGLDGTMLLWHLTSDGWRVADLPYLGTYVTALAYSADGTWLALGGADGTLWMANADGSSIQSWGRQWNGTPLQRELNASILRKQVTALMFSADARLLAVGFDNGQVDVWQTSGDKLHRTLSAHTDSVVALGFRPDGALVTVAGADVYVWKVRF